MAKFQSRHSKSKHRLFSGPLRLLVLIGVALVAALVLIPRLNQILDLSSQSSSTGNSERFYLPALGSLPIYHKRHYSLAYSEQHEQAAWVAYELTVEHLNARNKVKRSDYFKDDFSIVGGSAQFADYKRSGFTKGHLVPAADRNYSLEAMEETFLMSNISPQKYHCNAGIWRELEEQTRDWARKERALYIVSGPVLESGLHKIGRNKVSVPKYYFKALLDLDGDQKAIAFLIPNEKSDQHLREYAMSIDDVEEVIGLDLYHELMPDQTELKIESGLDLSAWRFDEERFRRRVGKWNN
ncbi:MAG: DNA/RNA non-specific endonuclease [Saprospiraceae bacterium]|nr:DNA/RNA non-specific endonuclease [Saprospiraceae bacterium]